jgi:ribosomal protein L7Ae-like RNA K-turn-binding protein
MGVDRNLQLLGMAKKAGLLAVGGEAAAAAARRGEAELIITASDASEGSVRRAKANAESNGVKYIAVPYTMFELGSTAGHGSPGTIAFLDNGLADGFTKRLAEAESAKEGDA